MDRNYTDINAQTIDRWVEEDWEWGRPISRETYAKALAGDWELLLTPIIPAPRDWFPPLKGARLLGLASGGGQQMPVFAALGADCTVLDYSEKQLASERMVAAREGYSINIVRADMTEKLPFADGSFDIIFHPVSNCYIEDVHHVWRECYRVLKSGGILLAGMDNGLNFLFADDDRLPLTVAYKLPFNPLKDPALLETCRKEDMGIQFSHSLEEQIGGQIRAGFILQDLYEDRANVGLLREYVPQYIATRAVKP
ncbi:MAG: class I SAM-dependent methyltransferase [Treponema sp.]|jgi:SAM-dependent methyltransferase|nr:class I SAM-dependent methyltransferase [Treponema sp.]